uniref:Nudix hydrolase domain-containing protein n=1 Tax=Oryza nivara TaxID=4536 RepID=A0A0E0HB13_ORYNI
MSVVVLVVAPKNPVGEPRRRSLQSPEAPPPPPPPAATLSMRPLLARLFAPTYIAMGFSSSASPPSRRLAHLTRHLLLSSGELSSSVGAPAAAARPAYLAAPKGYAAVLVCLFEDPHGGDPRVILTKRAASLSSHSGEVSLPGGKVEEGDADATATALREAKEEIGLDPALVYIVTVLEPFLSKNGLHVTPVIGILSDKALFKPVLNESEVADIFDAPLEMFLKDDNRKTQEANWMGMNIPVQSFEYQSEDKTFVIWGLTAHILTRAAAVVLQREPSFVEFRPRYVNSPSGDTNETKR